MVRSRSAFARKARLAGGAALLAAVTLALVVPAIAEVRIISSGGGSVGEYLDFFARVKQSGERVVIDGPCLSACTLVLSSIPRKRICVTSKAVLGFHAPYLLDKNGRTVHTRKATQAVVAAYPGGCQSVDQEARRIKSEGDPAEGPRTHRALSDAASRTPARLLTREA